MRNNTDHTYAVVDDTENRKFDLPFMYDGVELVMHVFLQSPGDLQSYVAVVDWSPITDHSKWLDRLDLDISILANPLVLDDGSTTIVSDNFNGAVHYSLKDELDELNDHEERITALEEASPVTGDFLKIEDSYDLEITEWFHGETGQKTQVGDTGEYRYYFTPNFELPRSVFVRNLNFTDWDNVVQIKSDGPRTFVLEYKDSEDNLHDMTFIP